MVLLLPPLVCCATAVPCGRSRGVMPPSPLSSLRCVAAAKDRHRRRYRRHRHHTGTSPPLCFEPDLLTLSLQKSHLGLNDEGAIEPIAARKDWTLICLGIIARKDSCLRKRQPVVRPIGELGPKALQQLLPDITLWMKTLDYERVDWFNKFLLHMWPFLDKVEIKRTIPLNKGVFFPLPTTSISFFSLVSTSIIASLLNSDNVFYFSSFLFFKCNTIFYVQEYICNMSSLRIRETEKALEKIERK